MTTAFWRNLDGTYEDDEKNILEVFELEHSMYGLIKYVVWDGNNTIVECPGEPPPPDWEDEIE